MRKLYFILLMSISYTFADTTQMSVDILKQITSGAVNANPDISDELADKTVVFSLQASALTLACKQKNRGDMDAQAKCVKTNKTSLNSIGALSESAFDVGYTAATQQAKIHRDVKVSDYYQVINQLVIYADNIQQSAIPNTPKIAN
ncbi:MAG: hypothetical protein PHC75_03835 [Burkholderiales bacterium]|nr:hypothetical protein [Burkholderiales bacterium]